MGFSNKKNNPTAILVENTTVDIVSFSTEDKSRKNVDEKVKIIESKIRKLKSDKAGAQLKAKRLEEENKRLKAKTQILEKEIIKKIEEPQASLDTSQKKDSKPGVVGEIISTAVEQLTGTGEYTPDPSRPAVPTTVDKVKDEIIGTGDFDVEPDKSGMDMIKDQIVGGKTRD